MSPAEAGSFWEWSLAFYDRPGVAQACIELQDRGGADVNLLLLGLWLARSGIALDATKATEIASWAGSWQREVVAPLRAARRGLKVRQRTESLAAHAAAPDDLRRKIAAVELEAERIEQRELERLVDGTPGAFQIGSAAALANWRQLQPGLGLANDAARHLLAAAFPDEVSAERDAAMAASA